MTGYVWPAETIRRVAGTRYALVVTAASLGASGVPLDVALAGLAVRASVTFTREMEVHAVVAAQADLVAEWSSDDDDEPTEWSLVMQWHPTNRPIYLKGGRADGKVIHADVDPTKPGHVHVELWSGNPELDPADPFAKVDKGEKIATLTYRVTGWDEATRCWVFGPVEGDGHG